MNHYNVSTLEYIENINIGSGVEMDTDENWLGQFLTSPQLGYTVATVNAMFSSIFWELS